MENNIVSFKVLNPAGVVAGRKNYYENEQIHYFYFKEYDEILYKASKFYKLIYLLLFETAARVSEARAIKYKDFDMEESRLTVKTLKQRGANLVRVLNISDKLQNMMLLHRIENNLTLDDYILAKKPGKESISEQAIDLKMKRDLPPLGIERNKAHCHTWRHTRAIQLLDAGHEYCPASNVPGTYQVRKSSGLS